MRAPWTPVLLVTAAIGLGVAGCASQPKQDAAARTVSQSACTDDPSNPLHLTTLRKDVPRDPETESLLNQRGDPRLMQVNRQMYQALRTLDAELRRQQQLEACKSGLSDIQSLQASTTTQNSGSGTAGAVPAGGANAAGGGAGTASVFAGTIVGSSADPVSGAAGANVLAPSMVTSSAGLAATGPGVAATARTSPVRKSSVPPTTTGGGGNGATAQKVSAGSDNDIVARRLRKAAEQETDPVLKAKLWKEYAQYQQANAAK